MNKQDRTRLASVHTNVNTLMNGTGNGITTADVVEAMLGDLSLVLGQQDPRYTRELLELDATLGSSPC